jgi:hypothetical protein
MWKYNQFIFPLFEVGTFILLHVNPVGADKNGFGKKNRNGKEAGFTS